MYRLYFSVLKVITTSEKRHSFETTILRDFLTADQCLKCTCDYEILSRNGKQDINCISSAILKCCRIYKFNTSTYYKLSARSCMSILMEIIF